MEELLMMGRLVRSDQLALQNFGCIVKCLTNRIASLESEVATLSSKTQDTVIIPMPDLSYGILTKTTSVKIKYQTMLIDADGNRYMQPIGQSGYESLIDYLYGDDGTFSILQLNLLNNIDAQIGYFSGAIGTNALTTLQTGGVISPLRSNMSSFGQAVVPMNTFDITLDDLGIDYENIMRVHYQGQPETVLGIGGFIAGGFADEASNFVKENVPIPFIDTIYDKVDNLVASLYYPKNRPAWVDYTATIEDGRTYKTYTWPSRSDFPQRPASNYASREDLLDIVYRQDGAVAGLLTGMSSQWRVYTYVQALTQQNVMDYFGKSVFNAALSMTVLSTVNAVSMNNVMVAYRDPGTGILLPVPNATLKPTSTTPIDLTV
jgi:hypothetical protein